MKGSTGVGRGQILRLQPAEADSVSSGFLGPVERGVGGVEHGKHAGGVPGKLRHADRRGHRLEQPAYVMSRSGSSRAAASVAVALGMISTNSSPP